MTDSFQVIALVALIFIAIQVWECSRFLQKILKLQIDQAGPDRAREALK